MSLNSPPASTPQPHAGPCHTPQAKTKRKRERISPQKRKRGLDLLQELYNLDAKYGEFAALLAPAIEAVKRETERTRLSDRDRVFMAIDQGHYTKAEIMQAAGLSEWDTRKILEELEDLDLIEVSRQRRPDLDAGDGVPVLLYQFTHRPLSIP